MFDIDEVYLIMEDEAQSKLEHLEIQLSKISSGAANPAILRGVKVMYYDELTNLLDIANVSVPEPMQLLIKPFDMSSVKDILVGLNKSGLDVNPVNEGDKIRITFQPMTTDRKKQMVKKVYQLEEEAKIGVRQARQHANNQITKHASEISEDLVDAYKAEVQKITDKYNKKLAEIAKEKEAQLLKV